MLQGSTLEPGGGNAAFFEAALTPFLTFDALINNIFKYVNNRELTEQLPIYIPFQFFFVILKLGMHAATLRHRNEILINKIVISLIKPNLSADISS